MDDLLEFKETGGDTTKFILDKIIRNYKKQKEYN